MTDDLLTTLMIEMREMIERPGVKQIDTNQRGVRISVKKTSTSAYDQDEGSYVLSYEDRRYSPRIVLKANPREWTLTFATFLHELGHIMNDHAPVTYDRLGNESWLGFLLEEELEAWCWARTKWHTVPLRTRYPFQYEMDMLSTYGYYDPITYYSHDDLIAHAHAEEDIIYKDFTHRSKVYANKEYRHLDPYTDLPIQRY